MKFYRYKGIQYATTDHNGEYTSSYIPNPTLILEEYNLFKETDKGYWIYYGSILPGKLRSEAIWVSKTAKKRFAYPSKEQALQGYIKRTEKRVRILQYQLDSCQMLLNDANCMIIK
jgi:hypothetical protein